MAKETIDLTASIKASIEQGMKKVQARKDELGKEKERLEYQLSQVNAEIASLDGQLRTAVKESLAAMGISLEAPAKREKGGGGRMTKEDKERMTGEIVRIVSAKKDGAAAGDVKAALSVSGLMPKEATLTKALGDLVAAKKLRKEGERRNTRYFSA